MQSQLDLPRVFKLWREIQTTNVINHSFCSVERMHISIWKMFCKADYLKLMWQFIKSDTTVILQIIEWWLKWKLICANEKLDPHSREVHLCSKFSTYVMWQFLCDLLFRRAQEKVCKTPGLTFVGLLRGLWLSDDDTAEMKDRVEGLNKVPGLPPWLLVGILSDLWCFKSFWGSRDKYTSKFNRGHWKSNLFMVPKSQGCCRHLPT